jgi:hypothetical protein
MQDIGEGSSSYWCEKVAKFSIVDDSGQAFKALKLGFLFYIYPSTIK